mmetsp:Transcript_7892/g.20368  ORF Transcript_7892/g.20368 Transcript_7892/m.20368 type:complete len:236 (-) Transcript_7892:114-821(-)
MDVHHLPKLLLLHLQHLRGVSASCRASDHEAHLDVVLLLEGAQGVRGAGEPGGAACVAALDATGVAVGKDADEGGVARRLRVALALQDGLLVIVVGPRGGRRRVRVLPAAVRAHQQGRCVRQGQSFQLWCPALHRRDRLRWLRLRGVLLGAHPLFSDRALHRCGHLCTGTQLRRDRGGAQPTAEVRRHLTRPVQPLQMGRAVAHELPEVRVLAVRDVVGTGGYQQQCGAHRRRQS